MQIDNQRKVHMTYDSMDELLNREEHIVTTLQNYLNRNGNKQYISNKEIKVGDDVCILTLTLDETE